jgi:tetratricopeptide (TPR) repeat protein
MKTSRIGRWGLAAVLGLSILASGVALAPRACLAAADDQGELRQKALSLNDITGDDPIEGQVKELIADPAGTKKLLAVAVKMTKEKDQPFNFTGAFILARAAHLLKDLDAGQALYRVCANEALKLRSTDKMAEAYLGLCELLGEQKKYDEEIKVCQEVLEIPDPDGHLGGLKGLVWRQMVRSKTKQGKADEALKLVDNLLKNRPDNWMVLDTKAWVQKEGGKFADAAKSWEAALDSIQKDKDLKKEQKSSLAKEIQFKLAGAYLDLNQVDKATDLFKPLLSQDEEGSGIRGRLAYVLEFRRMIRDKAKKDKAGDIVKLTESLAKAMPDNWMVVYIKGFAESGAGESEQAAKTWEDVLKRIEKDESLGKEKEIKGEFIKELHLMLSNAYVDVNQVDKAADHLKDVLAEDPDDPGANNDLGYIWADHDMNLDEAEKMIRKALEEDKKRRMKDPDENPGAGDNAAYLDSLGWVLFKKKKYQEAKAPLLEAVKDKEGKHVEIFDHLGDVHMALGEKKEAIAVWQEAIKLETESKREKEIKAKVEKKLKDAQGEAGAKK